MNQGSLKTGMGRSCAGDAAGEQRPVAGRECVPAEGVTSAPGLTPTGRLDSVMLVGWLPSTLDPGTKIKREAAAPGQAR